METWRKYPPVLRGRITLNGSNVPMGSSAHRPVQSTCAALPSPVSSWPPRPARRTRWAQSARHRIIFGPLKMALIHDGNQMCVCVCACAACALSEGAGYLQQLWLFPVRDPAHGEAGSGQAELGPAHGHGAGLPAHREFFRRFPIYLASAVPSIFKIHFFLRSYLEHGENSAEPGRTCQVHTKRAGIAPSTFLLWGCSTNHWCQKYLAFCDIAIFVP